MIIRASHRDRFLVVANQPIEDARLSWKARGLLTYLLTKPDHWVVRTSQLVASGPDGRDSVLSGLRELEKLGYLRRSSLRDEDGRFDGATVEVHELLCAETSSATPLPETANPNAGNGFSENGLAGYGEPATSKEGDVVSTETSKHTLSPPARVEKTSDATVQELVDQPEPDVGQPTADVVEQAFDRAWSLHPRKLERKRALRAYRTTRRRGVSEADLLAAVTHYAALCGRRNTEPRFMKLGSTFFGSDEPWRDYVEKGLLDEDRGPSLNPKTDRAVAAARRFIALGDDDEFAVA